MSQDRAGVIIVDGDNILLMSRKKEGDEYYCIPGGHIESGETPEQTAIREIKEETTLDIELTEFMVELENQGRKETYFFAKNFTGSVKLSGEEAEYNSPENQFELHWVPISMLSQLIVYPEQMGQNLAHIIESLK
jgi:ADP-ribose pyrophosphatase YjhB (NUDIX family)